MAVEAPVGAVADPEVRVDEDLPGERGQVDELPEATVPPVPAERQDEVAARALVDGVAPHPAADLALLDVEYSGGGLPGEPLDAAADRLEAHRRRPERLDVVASPVA